ncbi:BREX-1 system adenine-specific DNA-methyltransferase PglX [Oscillibacter valericigenes]|nr:BREX-1 system adenine-specific DNA-methyltransferase PglX [Oscillibacter valericigenes]
MNKSAIQKFAVWARTALMEQVAQRAYQYGVTAEGFGEERAVTVNGQVLTPQEQQQRHELVLEVQTKGYAQVVEEVAYTWFNRFIALRYMEVNNFLPSHIRVFSNAAGAFDPEIMKEALHLELLGLDRSRVADYIEHNEHEALYRYLLLTQCNALNEALPKMFEKMGGYTELLFPNNMLRPESVVGHMVANIPEDDWRDAVQIIGWMYQYYNTEPKAKVFADLKKNIKISRENIPAATQLFTPDWIVRYMVENSLGRLWMEGHPNDTLKSGWKYYLDEATQEPEVERQLAALRAEHAALRPEEIKVIDPCMGSGHILVYAFDVLMQIYESAGWSQRDAAASIVQKNLYGLDIDSRAAQLAYFAVMMKARQYDRRFLTRGIQPNLYAPEGYADGREFGSLLTVETLEPRPEPTEELSLFEESYEHQLNTWNFHRLLAQKYDVVVTNPPYMGSSGMSAALSEFVKKRFPDSKSDLFACFIERCGSFACEGGYQAMITQHSWMFLSSFEKLRGKLLRTVDIENMAHLGARAFDEIGGEVVQTTSFVIRKSHVADYKGEYCRLIKPTSQQGKEDMFLAGANRYAADQSNFSKIPGSPVAYWVSNAFLRAFDTGVLLGKIADAKQGVATADNNRFLRLWNEVSINKVSFHTHSHEEAATAREKWFPYNKGGDFRKWYGNNEFVVNWEHDGAELKQFKGSVLRNPSYYFKECFSWSLISSSVAAFRYKPAGQIFDVAGMSCFASEKQLNYLLALCNTKVVMIVLEVIAPTINYQCGDIANIPVIQDGDTNDICEVTQDNISISKTDWDSYETSWDFKKHPLI